MKSEFAPIAQRLVNAEEHFAGIVSEITGCDLKTGMKILGYYRKHKLVKLQLGIGRYTVKHGALLDADVLRRAINEIG